MTLTVASSTSNKPTDIQINRLPAIAHQLSASHLNQCSQFVVNF
jgi:hypothetical protein